MKRINASIRPNLLTSRRRHHENKRGTELQQTGPTPLSYNRMSRQQRYTLRCQ